MTTSTAMLRRLLPTPTLALVHPDVIERTESLGRRLAIARDLVVKGDDMSRESLGHFELLVLLALLRQGDEAYGVPIARAIEESTGKAVILASVYNTLERLEEKGLVRSTVGQPTRARGGRAKRYFAITAAGLREVTSAKKALTILWRGIPVHEG